MKKEKIIKEIIEMQKEGKKKKLFFEIAKKEDLLKLTKNDLIMIYNASYISINK